MPVIYGWMNAIKKMPVSESSDVIFPLEGIREIVTNYIIFII